MVGRKLVRTVATLLPALLLGAVLHVHVEAGPRASVITAPDAACPVCATVRGGMGSPESAGPLPTRPAQVIALAQPASVLLDPFFTDLPVTRGPPTSLPV